MKITLDVKKYTWQKLKPRKLNITIKQILKPTVTIVVETHSELDGNYPSTSREKHC
jgi:hypothetical protein